MVISKQRLFAAVVTLLAGTALLFAIGASGSRGKGHDEVSLVLRASLAPVLPGDPTFHGVAAAGAPWALQEGSVSLRDDGKFRLEVKGLVLTVAPFTGTPGP